MRLFYETLYLNGDIQKLSFLTIQKLVCVEILVTSKITPSYSFNLGKMLFPHSESLRTN